MAWKFGQSQDGSSSPSNKRLRILVAIFIGMAAFILNLMYLKQGERLTVLRVTQAASAGVVLNERVQVKPVTIIGEDLATMRKLFVTQDVKGVFLKMPLAEAVQPGQLLTQRAFRLDSQTRLNLKEGERAVSFRVREDSAALVCFVGPEGFIDVWAQIKQGEPTLVIRNARLLAVGDAVAVARLNQCNDSRFHNLTVAVAEAEVKAVLQTLDLAQKDIRITVPPFPAALVAK
jgi:hypothetical protein